MPPSPRSSDLSGVVDVCSDVRRDLIQALAEQPSPPPDERGPATAQFVLERLLILRFLEDRRPGHPSYVAALAEQSACWAAFHDLVSELRASYGSTLFPCAPAPGIDLSASSDALLRGACRALAGLDFQTLPFRLLGTVYEQSLAVEARWNEEGVQLHRNRSARKAGGVYYTPGYIVEYIVARVVSAPLAARSRSDDSPPPYIADIACGGGAFLLAAYDRLLQTSSGPPVRSFAERRRRLTDSLRGVDLDPGAVDVARRSLLLKLLDGQPASAGANLPDLSSLLVAGNVLEDPQPFGQGGLFPDDEDVFRFRRAFPSVAARGGFDVVVGNPPYGAALSKRERRRLRRRFDLGTSDTAALFMALQDRLLHPGGRGGFIVPKAFCYASNWKRLRAQLLDALTELIDVSRAWPNVKLEQVIYLCRRGASSPTYLARTRERDQQSFTEPVEVPKRACRAFDFLICGVDRREMQVAEKIASGTRSLHDYASNRRGVPLQQQLEPEGTVPVVGGKQIRRYRLARPRGYVDEGDIQKGNAYAGPRCILVQNIVAHVKHPYDRIRIIAAIPDQQPLAILDTVNQLRLTSPLSPHFVLGLLHSRLINWYVYRFIFARAIRTMHFDAPVTRRIPVPALKLSDERDGAVHDRLVETVRRLERCYRTGREEAASKSRPALQDERQRLQQHLDEQVFALYGLEAEDVHVVRGDPGE